MKKNIFFIHCAGAQGPNQGSSILVSYLQEALGAKYNMLYPKMPNPENPKCTQWMAQIDKEFSALDGETILIGHSLGGSVLMKYLSENTCQLPISGLFMIASPYWGKDRDWQNEEYVLGEHFAPNLPPVSQMFFYHSHNDEIVPFAHLMHYSKQLPMATIRELEGDEHYFRDGLPELIRDISSL